MKHVLILGGGTAGTMVANRLAHELEPDEWQITVVDESKVHYYQPGFLLIPFGIYRKRDVIRPRRDYIDPRVNVIFSPIEVIEPDKNRVRIREGNRWLPYDFLIIATGVRLFPEETPGLKDGEWHRSIFDFYTLEGSLALARKFQEWEGGRLVLNIVDMPIKCPVAPLEFVFLADWFFTERGIRDRVEIVLATPLPGAFTKPKASEILGGMMEERGIQVVTEFYAESVDPEKKVLRSYEEEEIPFDLLVTIPLHKGDPVIERSGIGDGLNYVPTDKHTLKAKHFDNVFVLGDATDLPASKAGAVAHFEVDSFVPNFLRYIQGLDLLPTFDGHANCYIETGYGKATLIDFNYDVEPLPGTFPLPGLGPFTLLGESRINHWGKLMFRWIYWNILMKGKELPIPAQMSMAGKRVGNGR